MVKQIQTSDEYYDPYEDDDDPLGIFVAPDYFETDEQLVLIACLMILEQRYRLMQSMTPSQVVDEVESIMDSLLVDLDDMAYVQAERHIKSFFDSVLDDYSIPDGYVDMDYSMIDIMRDSIDNLVTQLGGELKVKSKFFVDNMTIDDFNILPNFKRAVRKLIDGVGSNLIWGKEKSLRNVEEFVYGEDKLYYWITANDDKVCAWCRYQESLPPRTLKEMPLDHWNGRCEHEPVDYMYSNEYMLMLARGEYRGEIEANTPEYEMSQATGRIQAPRRRK